MQASADDVTPSVGRYLRRSGALTEVELKEATAQAGGAEVDARLGAHGLGEAL